jgi:hypothetical protein
MSRATLGWRYQPSLVGHGLGLGRCPDVQRRARGRVAELHYGSDTGLYVAGTGVARINMLYGTLLALKTFSEWS